MLFGYAFSALAAARQRIGTGLQVLAVLAGAGLVGLVLTGCGEAGDDGGKAASPADTAGAAARTVPEAAVQRIPLGGPLATPEAEISGLAWQGDRLILLPQYPFRAGRPDRGFVYALRRAQIEAALADTASGPLQPLRIAVAAPQLRARTPVYQGCEAIAFQEATAYLLVEATADTVARSATGGNASAYPTMRGYLLRGTLSGNRSVLRFDTEGRRRLPVQTDAPNMAYEALLTTADRVVALHEANGARVNDRPQTLVYSPSLERLGARPFPTMEYRVTDATTLGDGGRFWVTNYFFPGERDVLRPAPDSLALRHGTGRTHRRADAVERLVPLRLTETGVRPADRPPIWLRLAEGDARNWEGLVRWDDGQFLVVTDRFPETILALVEAPP